MSDKVKVGDTIIYRPDFGLGKPTLAKVEAIELTDRPREKYGFPVNEVPISIIKDNYATFILDNGRWMYSDQFIEVLDKKED